MLTGRQPNNKLLTTKSKQGNDFEAFPSENSIQSNIQDERRYSVFGYRRYQFWIIQVEKNIKDTPG